MNIKHIVSIALLTLFCSSAYAETISRSENFSSFTGVKVANNFELSMETGSSYGVRLVIDDRISDYVSATIVGSNLFIEVNEKQFPSALKKQIRQKGPSLTMQAVIIVPQNNHLSTIDLGKNVTLTGLSKFNMSQNLTITLADNVIVKTFDASAPEVFIKTSNKADFNGKLKCSSFACETYGQSNISATVSAKSCSIYSENSSKASITASATTTVVNAANSSKLTLKGDSETLDVTGKNSAKMDMSMFNANSVTLKLSGCFIECNPVKTLSILAEDNATVTYNGSPAIQIDRIKSSSIYRTSDSKAKRIE